MTRFLFIVFTFIFVVNANGAPSPKRIDTATTTTTTNDESDPNMATDSVDKPILKPIVTTSPAPPLAPESNEAAAPSEEKAVVDDGDAELTKAGEVAMPAPKSAASEEKSSPSEMEVKLKPKSVATPPAKSHGKTAVTKPAMKPELKTPPKAPAKTEATAAATEEASPSAGVSADQSMKWLMNGNTRFATKKFRADGRSAADREKLVAGQHPHAIILSCSDSRVPPELLFDQGLGEITTIRVSGEVLDSSVIASIETAIQREHPHLLVVLGHTQCESIEAALNWKDTATNGSDALDRMVAEIKPHLRSLSSGTPRSPGLQVEAVLQADGVSRDLTSKSEIIKKAVDSGELTIKTGLYWIDTGRVKFY